METHAEHLHHAPGKKFWHYFFEFFMLFLAVTLGFFVENMREHYVERQREGEYIHSIAEDLKQDIYDLDSIIAVRLNKDRQMDSLFRIINYSDPNKQGNEVYGLVRWVPRTYRFYSHDRTVLQLKNAGNWRLIRNKQVTEALQSYDEYVRSITVYIEEREESLVQKIYPSIFELFDAKVFENMLNGLSFDRPVNNPQLLSIDKKLLNTFSNQLHFLRNANYYFIQRAQILLKIAHNTLDLLEKEYHFT